MIRDILRKKNIELILVKKIVKLLNENGLEIKDKMRLN